MKVELDGTHPLKSTNVAKQALDLSAQAWKRLVISKAEVIWNDVGADENSCLEQSSKER